MGDKPAHSRIQGLDVVRGFAILLVLLRHAWPETFGGAGIVGVVVFFTLSGYLITGVLMRDIRSHGKVRYGRFYRNRALRLIPPLMFFLAGFAVYTAIFNPFDDRGSIVRAVIVGITYTGNIPFEHGSPAIEHLWTLATEEQFYLVWPAILAVAFRWKRLRLAVGVSLVSLLALCAISLILVEPSFERVYRLPTSWAAAMVIGAAASLSSVTVDRFMPKNASGRILAVGLVLALIALSFVPESKENPLSYLVGGPIVALLSVMLIFYVRDWRKIPSVWFKPLLSLGTISYAAYLWNYPIARWLGESALSGLASIVLTIIAASVSWWVVEVPAQRWRARLDANTVAPIDRRRSGLKSTP